VAGARVLLGDRGGGVKLVQSKDGEELISKVILWAETDKSGKFEILGIPPGRYPLQVVPENFSVWEKRLTVKAGENQNVTVHLKPAATLWGTALNPGGKAEAGVRISVGKWNSLKILSTESAPDGTYQLEGISIGRFEANVHFSTGERAAKSFSGVGGGRIEWNPMKDAGFTIAGRIIRPDGTPLKDWFVFAHSKRYWKNSPSATTDEKGEFLLKNCKDIEYEISTRPKVDPNGIHELYDPPEGEFVRPNQGPVTLVIPVFSSRILALVTNSSGKPIDGAELGLNFEFEKKFLFYRSFLFRHPRESGISSAARREGKDLRQSKRIWKGQLRRIFPGQRSGPGFGEH